LSTGKNPVISGPPGGRRRRRRRPSDGRHCLRVPGLPARATFSAGYPADRRKLRRRPRWEDVYEAAFRVVIRERPGPFLRPMTAAAKGGWPGRWAGRPGWRSSTHRAAQTPSRFRGRPRCRKMPTRFGLRLLFFSGARHMTQFRPGASKLLAERERHRYSRLRRRHHPGRGPRRRREGMGVAEDLHARAAPHARVVDLGPVKFGHARETVGKPPGDLAAPGPHWLPAQAFARRPRRRPYTRWGKRTRVDPVRYQAKQALRHFTEFDPGRARWFHHPRRKTAAAAAEFIAGGQVGRGDQGAGPAGGRGRLGGVKFRHDPAGPPKGQGGAILGLGTSRATTVALRSWWAEDIDIGAEYYLSFLIRTGPSPLLVDVGSVEGRGRDRGKVATDEPDALPGSRSIGLGGGGRRQGPQRRFVAWGQAPRGGAPGARGPQLRRSGLWAVVPPAGRHGWSRSTAGAEPGTGASIAPPLTREGHPR